MTPWEWRNLPLKLLKTHRAEFEGLIEVWEKGNAVFALLTLNDRYDSDLNQALTTRREAMFTGECPDCGAMIIADKALIIHADFCKADDSNVMMLLVANLGHIDGLL